MYGFRNETDGEYVEMLNKNTLRRFRKYAIEDGCVCSDIEYNHHPLAKIIWLGEEITEKQLVKKFTSHTGDDEEIDYDGLCGPMIDEAFSDALDILSRHRDSFGIEDVVEAYLKLVEPDLVYGELYRDYICE